ASDFVLKPARGAGGSGIVVIVERRERRFVKASGATLGRRDLEAHACDVIAGTYSPGGQGDALLVEERVVAEPVLAALAYRGVPALERNARPGLGIQLANRRGLRPVLEALARATLPANPEARVRVGRDLAAGG